MRRKKLPYGGGISLKTGKVAFATTKKEHERIMKELRKLDDKSMINDKQTAIIEDFERMFGKRPDKRSKFELIEELKQLEQRIVQLRNTIIACECYESAWEGFVAGNERGKRV